MKSISINIAGILFWTIVGHFFSPYTLLITPFYIPLLFLFVGLFTARQTNIFLYTTFCFVLLLLNDLLFRFFGGGTHDDLGRDLCNIIFYITFSATTLTLLSIEFIERSGKIEIAIKAKLSFKVTLLYVLFILLISAITFLLFWQFNRMI